MPTLFPDFDQREMLVRPLIVESGPCIVFACDFFFSSLFVFVNSFVSTDATFYCF